MSAGTRRWTAAVIPDLSGRTAVVTGASAGIGLETARVLAGHGALVVLACRNIERAKKLNRALISPGLRIFNFWFAQSVQMGALPTLRAAVDPSAQGGEFYGPRRRFDTGYPARVESSARSHDVADQARLWEVSEQLTGVSYRIKASPTLP